MDRLPQAHTHWLRLHGTAGWRRGDGAVGLLERKHAALLAWLWLEGPSPRARLAGLLWPEASEERARGNLRQRLLKLRQEVGDLVADAAGTLSLGVGVVVEPPDPPGAPLLDGLAFDDCDDFTRWLEGRRDSERERRKREWLAEVREAALSQRLDDALYAADQLLQADRESEESYRVLMEVYYLRGDHAAALSTWDRCRDMLRQLYGVKPSPATEQLGRTLLDAARLAQAAQEAWAPTPSSTRQLPATVLRPPRLVGRAAAMQGLIDGWEAGHVLWVTGVAGVGKSRLLADWQAALGRPVAAASARPGDGVMPYAALSRLLLGAIDRFAPDLHTPHAAQAARLMPRLAALAGRAAEPVRTDYERTQALLATARLMGDCMRRGCAAFVLDDLQFADPASIAALRALVEPSGDAGGLRFVLAVRADEIGPDVAALQAALAATAHFAPVALAPLSAAEAGELLASLGVTTLDVGLWAPRIWAQVGGNPAFLLESLKLLLSSDAERTASAAALALPPSIEAVIERRVELLSPRARHLAQLAAIAGSGYSVPLAAAALACTPLELGEPLRELELRQVFYGRQFVHDVIASVTARSVPATVAEFMHRFVAEHLAGHGGDPAQIGTHWRACGEWRQAGACFLQAARAAGAAALSNEQAALLNDAIAAFERDPAAHDALFTAIEERTNVFESTGHEGLRPQFIARLQALARTEPQQLSALVHHNGWLTNLGQPIEEARIQAGIGRAVAVGRSDLAWSLARMLGLYWAMNNRADDGLALLTERGASIEAGDDGERKVAYRVARASIFAFGDRLPEAIAEGRLALRAAEVAQDWPNVLPAMSNLGVMHYWRGEYDAAHEVLSQARAHRERLYGSSGSGIKIDIHLGAVLYELGRHAEAQEMLEGALAEMMRWPDNEYRRTECLLTENHLAQMFIALGRADAAAAVLARDATGVAERFYARRLTLRLRWQRVFDRVDSARVTELREVAGRMASPFNRTLAELELARHLPAQHALAELRRLHDSPVAVQRPGLQLHAAALGVCAAWEVGDASQRDAWAARAHALQALCAPFDMPADEVGRLLAAG
jgi:DNA-binding SARP family transcriptional activator